jgi:hypothetical protein
MRYNLLLCTLCHLFGVNYALFRHSHVLTFVVLLFYILVTFCSISILTRGCLSTETKKKTRRADLERKFKSVLLVLISMLSGTLTFSAEIDSVIT